MSKLLLIALILGAVWLYFRKPVRKPLPDVAEAQAILGLTGEPNVEQVRAAHRRLIAGVHPDRGGSPELTSRINAARDVLLRRLGG